MDVKDLKFFVAVYNAKSFSGATNRLDTVQSNVSTRIRNLEEFLGVQLFERCYRHVKPTQSGIRFYDYAIQVIAEMDRTEREFRLPRRVGGALSPARTSVDDQT